MNCDRWNTYIINNKLDVADTVSMQYPDAQFFFCRYLDNDVKFSWYNREYRVPYFSPKVQPRRWVNFEKKRAASSKMQELSMQRG